MSEDKMEREIDRRIGAVSPDCCGEESIYLQLSPIFATQSVCHLYLKFILHNITFEFKQAWMSKRCAIFISNALRAQTL